MKRFIHIIQTALFCLLLLAALSEVSDVLKRKESDVKYRPFIEAGEEFDVLFMGNSHTVNGIFPMELWDDYGIASYNIAGYGNTIPVSYWAMINAFDYASPKLMVIDISNVSKENKLTGSSGDLHKALDCYPLSLNKLRAVHDLIDDPAAVDDDGNSFMDMKWEYLLSLGKYHSRWNDLGRSDFILEPNVQKGGESIINVAVPREYQIYEHGYASEEIGFGFVYLRKMIEECQRRNIEVLLTHLPFPTKEYQQNDANAVRYIAEEYGINFVDLVYLDQVVDYETDLFDPSSHLNASGGKKVTDFLGKYIRDHYDIPDRKMEANYSHWNDDFQQYLNKKIEDIRRQNSAADMLMLLHDNDFSLNLFIPEGSTLYDSDLLLLLMHNVAREHVFEEDEFIKYSASMFPLLTLDEAVWDASAYFLSIDRETGTFTESLGSEAEALYAQYFGQDTLPEGPQLMLLDAKSGEQLLEKALSI